MNKIVKGILLDYGGTIDTNGVHWAEVLWNAYVACQVPVSREAFWEAYRFGEYSLATSPVVKPHHNFLDVLLLKIERQFFHLQDNKHLEQGNYSLLINLVATRCNNIAAETIRETSGTLEWLYSKFPLVMVSNFYGNLETVLTGFGIRKYFREIVESSVVGVRKPSPSIYTLGVSALHLPAGECLVIGDSYTKDMVPGKDAGCQTIWLKKAGFGDDPESAEKADRIIGDFAELRQLL